MKKPKPKPPIPYHPPPKGLFIKIQYIRLNMRAHGLTDEEAEKKLESELLAGTVRVHLEGDGMETIYEH